MGWQLELAERYDFRRWSYGLVETVDDLYDPRIWGPTCDAVCGCGKYEGREHDGVICDMCGVKVAVDSEMLRKTRCGHVRLIVPCTHPMGTTDDRIDEFTVAPSRTGKTQMGCPTHSAESMNGCWKFATLPLLKCPKKRRTWGLGLPRRDASTVHRSRPR